jgi:hypothetical protein
MRILEGVGRADEDLRPGQMADDTSRTGVIIVRKASRMS